MTHNRTWAAEDIARALHLKTTGMSYTQIGDAMGRTQRAVQCALERHAGGRVCRDIYNGDPIGRCDDFIRFQRNAVEGSARLLEAIQRASGQERIAA
jgi:hypothetical protein